MRSVWWILGLCVGMVSWAPSARAQLNVETLASGVTAPGWSMGATNALSFYTGNVDLFEVRGDASAAYATAHPDAPADAKRFWFRDRALAYGSAGLKIVSDEQVANDGFGHLRYTRMQWLRVGGEVFGQVQYDDFRLLKRRLVAGAGGRFVFANFEEFSGWVGTGYMVEDEQRRIPEEDRPPMGPERRHNLNHRWNTYLTMVAWPQSDTLSVVNTLYVQPRFDKPEDIQLFDEFTALFSIVDHFSFTVGLTLRYDSRAPTSVKRLDVRLVNGVMVRL